MSIFINWGNARYSYADHNRKCDECNRKIWLNNEIGRNDAGAITCTICAWCNKVINSNGLPLSLTTQGRLELLIKEFYTDLISDSDKISIMAEVLGNRQEE